MKLCVMCEHWDFDGGEPGYSELTPGYDASMDCRKGHWGKRFRIYDISGPEGFRKQISMAETCPDYSSPSTSLGRR